MTYQEWCRARGYNPATQAYDLAPQHVEEVSWGGKVMGAGRRGFSPRAEAVPEMPTRSQLTGFKAFLDTLRSPAS